MRFPMMTIRRWMSIVAVTAIPLGVCVERRSRFLGLAASHELRATEFEVEYDGCSTGNSHVGWWYSLRDNRAFEPDEGRRRHALHEWHRDVAEKYRDAARSPWLSVAPDPPEPE